MPSLLWSPVSTTSASTSPDGIMLATQPSMRRNMQRPELVVEPLHVRVNDRAEALTQRSSGLPPGRAAGSLTGHFRLFKSTARSLRNGPSDGLGAELTDAGSSLRRLR